MGPKHILIASVLAIALSAGVILAVRDNAPTEPQAALMYPSPVPLPDISLIDQLSNPVTADTFRGQWDIVFFGFTHCPDICPATLQILATAKRELKKSAAKEQPRIVLVSVDPERDTPAKLHDYVKHFGEGNLGVTGKLENIRQFTKPLGIYFEKRELDGGNYTVDHSAAVLVFNPRGEVHALFSAPHSVENYVHDLALMMSNANSQMPLVASNVEVTEPVPGMQVSAAYLNLSNNTTKTISISRILSAQFRAVEIHESTVEDGVAKMRQLFELLVPPGKTVRLERGAKHLMLMQPVANTGPLSLQFFDGDKLVLVIKTPDAPEAEQ